MELEVGFPMGRDKGKEFPSLSRDNGTSSKSCHGTGRAETAYQNTGWNVGWDNHYFSVKIQNRTGTGRDNHYFFFL